MTTPFDPASFKDLGTPQIIGVLLFLFFLTAFFVVRQIMANGMTRYEAEQELIERNNDKSLAILRDQLQHEINEMKREREEWKAERAEQTKTIERLQARLTELEGKRYEEKFAHREEIHTMRNQNMILLGCIDILLGIYPVSGLDDNAKEQIDFVKQRVAAVREANKS